jgi:hypothetical protein
MKWLANTGGGGKNAQLSFLEQVLNEVLLCLIVLSLKELRVASLLLPSGKTLLGKEK